MRAGARHGLPLFFGTSQCPYPLALPPGPAFGVVLVLVTPTLRWPGPALWRAMSSRLLLVLRVCCLEYLRPHLLFDAEEGRLQDDIVRRDAPDVEEFRELDAERRTTSAGSSASPSAARGG